MLEEKKIACIIPARLKSTRFPEKILKKILDKPILQWVWEAANKVDCFDEIIFAIDSEKTASLIKSFGGKFIMTSPDCNSGTDRLIEVVNSGKIKADIIVNWQGDEPFINTKMIETLLSTCAYDNADVWTLKKRIEKEEDIISPNIAKVVCDINNFAMYFSRSTIPFYRDKEDLDRVYYKHVGIYAYTINALQKISKFDTCYLEDAEKLEQLRFLYNNLKIKVNETEFEVVGIDTPQDLEKAEKRAAKI